MHLPKARPDKLIVRELPDETLIYDLVAAKAHCLNRTAALVWKGCDGRTSPAELARRLGSEMGMPMAAAVVQLALEQLQRRHLLQGPVPALSDANRRSRRDLFKKLGTTMLALPVIMTVASPHARAAASGCSNDGQCSSLTTNSGCILGKCQNGHCGTAFAPEDTSCGTDGEECDGAGTCTCFPAGTLVTTPGGFRPIEAFQAGDPVWGFNLVAQEWSPGRVARAYEHDFAGSMLAITFDGGLIDATDNHPFWVIGGHGLEQRARTPVADETPPDSRTPGRWVDAGDLRVGDILRLQTDRPAAVTRLATRQVRQKVYHVHLGGEGHAYAVGQNPVMVMD